MNDQHFDYLQQVSYAVLLLKAGDLQQAEYRINNALLLDSDAPDTQNLLGILAELKGNDGIARKHYRAAYALDPTYNPASNNLERLCRFSWGLQTREFDYGQDSKVSQEELQDSSV